MPNRLSIQRFVLEQTGNCRSRRQPYRRLSQFNVMPAQFQISRVLSASFIRISHLDVSSGRVVNH
jgi:hypothetical protein